MEDSTTLYVLKHSFYIYIYIFFLAALGKPWRDREGNIKEFFFFFSFFFLPFHVMIYWDAFLTHTKKNEPMCWFQLQQAVL